MAKKHLIQYYNKLEQQRNKAMSLLEELGKISTTKMLTQEKVNCVQEYVKKLCSNNDRVAWVLHLLHTSKQTVDKNYVRIQNLVERTKQVVNELNSQKAPNVSLMQNQLEIQSSNVYRWQDIMYLLNKPVRKEKQVKYDKQWAKKVEKYREEHKEHTLDGVYEENEKALKSIEKLIKE